MTEPTTAAGRALDDALVERLGLVPRFTDAVLAIEDEARAAALDEARAVMRGLSLPPGPEFAWVDGHMPFIEAAEAAIDALRGTEG